MIAEAWYNIISIYSQIHESGNWNQTSRGQDSRLQIQRSGFESWIYQIFWEIVGLERSPLSLMSITEELLGRRNSDSGQEKTRWPRDTLYPQKLALTSTTSGGRSVSIVRSQTKATELLLIYFNSISLLQHICRESVLRISDYCFSSHRMLAFFHYNKLINSVANHTMLHTILNLIMLNNT
jgi:hypothetical protein